MRLHFLAAALLAAQLAMRSDAGAASDAKQDDAQRDPAELLFLRLFRRRRAEQQAAVRQMAALPLEKRRKMAAVVVERLFAVVMAARATLEAAAFVAGSSAFPPPDSHELHALSNVAENVCLHAEVSLRLPDAAPVPSEAELAALRWGRGFAADARLLDAGTARLLRLAGQQLGLDPPDPDFVNPYVAVTQPPLPPVSPQRVRKPRLPRRPRITPRHLEL